MAYKTDDLFELALKAIEKHEPLFIEDIISFLPCSKPTFYEHFPVDSDELNQLKEKLEVVKIKQKSELRKNWKDAEAAPALQLALYKLLASPNEHQALQMTYNDHTTKGEKINIISLGSGKNPDESNT